MPEDFKNSAFTSINLENSQAPGMPMLISPPLATSVEVTAPSVSRSPAEWLTFVQPGDCAHNFDCGRFHIPHIKLF